MRKIILPVIMLCALFSFGQEEETTSWMDGFTLSGSIDAYFRQNLNATNKVFNDSGSLIYSAPGTSFANRPGFAIGMANVVLGYEKGSVGAVADLVYGPRGEDAVFLSTGNSSIVNQLYVYWNVSEKVKLTFGNWNTFLGYEVISPAANFNYSTSYMFSYGPFSHTGLKADFTLDDNWSAMLAIMNPTDYTEFNPTGSYSYGAQLGYSADGGSAYLNFLVGDQDGDYGDEGLGSGNGTLFQVDLTAGLDLTDTFYLGLNTTYNSTADANESGDDDAGFYGVALYAQLGVTDNFAVGIRPEYFSEFGDFGAIGATDLNGDADVFAVTLSGNVTIGDLKLIPEFRLDSASEDAFLDEINNSMASYQKSLGSFILAAVYSF